MYAIKNIRKNSDLSKKHFFINKISVTPIEFLYLSPWVFLTDTRYINLSPKILKTSLLILV